MTAIKASVPLRYAFLTVVAAIVTLSIKFYAAWLTSSVGLFADAMESIVNLVTSVVLVVLVRIAQAPPDDEHPHGHDKAEYFANGVQGTLIILAGLGIVEASVTRFLHPRALEAGGWGLALSLVAAAVNAGMASLLSRAGKASRSTALEGEASHLMSDVWTSVAVFGGVGLVYLTGWPWLDPLIGVLLSLFIFGTGLSLVKESVAGLMDRSLPLESQTMLTQVLDSYCQSHSITYHALRSRQSGARAFVSVHILVPGDWTVREGHRLTDEIEAAIAQILVGVSVLTHLEPIDDALSFEDIHL